MSDYTPTTAEMRELFRESTPDGLPPGLSMTDREWDVYLLAAFDRWLAEVKAAAWDEALQAVAWADERASHPGEALLYAAKNNRYRTP